MAKKKQAVAPLPPAQKKVSKAFTKNNSGKEIVPVNAPRSLTWNGAGKTNFDYIYGIQSIAPETSILPPAYFSAYISQVGNRASAYKDFVSSQIQLQKEARFVERSLNNLNHGAAKKIPGLSGTRARDYLRESGIDPDNLPEETGETLDSEMQEAGMFVPPVHIPFEDIIQGNVSNDVDFTEAERGGFADHRAEPLQQVYNDAQHDDELQHMGDTVNYTLDRSLSDVQGDILDENRNITRSISVQADEHDRYAYAEQEIAQANERLQQMSLTNEANEAELLSAREYINALEQDVATFEEQLRLQNDSMERLARRAANPKRRRNLRDPGDDSAAKRQQNDRYVPPRSEIDAVMTAIDASSTHAEAQDTLRQYIASFEGSARQLDLDLDTMMALSARVSNFALRDNIRSLQSELARGVSSQRARQIADEIAAYENILRKSSFGYSQHPLRHVDNGHM